MGQIKRISSSNIDNDVDSVTHGNTQSCHEYMYPDVAAKPSKHKKWQVMMVLSYHGGTKSLIASKLRTNLWSIDSTTALRKKARIYDPPCVKTTYSTDPQSWRRSFNYYYSYSQGPITTTTLVNLLNCAIAWQLFDIGFQKWFLKSDLKCQSIAWNQTFWSTFLTITT